MASDKGEELLNMLACAVDLSNIVRYCAGRYTEYIVIPWYYLCTVLIPADFFYTEIS